MNIFDTRTAFLIAGLLYFLMPLVVWMALRTQKTTSIAQWCIGGELFGLGLLLISLRSQVPDWISYDLAALCMHVGNVTRIQAMQNELGKPMSRPVFAGVASIFWLGYETGRMIEPYGSYHFVWSLLAIAFQSLWIAHLSRQLAAKESIDSARWLSLAYLPMAVILCVRVLQVVSGSASHGPLIDEYTNMGMALLGIVAAVVGNTSFLGIYAERASRQQIQKAKEDARREETARLGRQIAHLDRQRGLGLIAQSLAHELSQPLTNINIIAERAELKAIHEKGPDSPFVQYAADILRNTQVAVDIMNRIRGYIKAKDIEFQPVSLQQVCTNVTHLMNDWLRSEQIGLEIQITEQDLWVQGDPVQLSQILFNLLRNAGQACSHRPQPRITLRLYTEGDHAMVQVQDNGSGFSPQALLNDTKQFVSTKIDGLGVGLSISSHIAELHHGSLSLNNAPEGGAQVTVSLPLSLPLRPTAA